jgi:hypothetical protein
VRDAKRGAGSAEHGDAGVGGHGGVATLSTNSQEVVASVASEVETRVDTACSGAQRLSRVPASGRGSGSGAQPVAPAVGRGEEPAGTTEDVWSSVAKRGKIQTGGKGAYFAVEIYQAG